jgi:hypothetical protein
MAKIKLTGKKKPAAGPKAPGAVSCIVFVVLIFTILGFLIYYSIARA